MMKIKLALNLTALAVVFCLSGLQAQALSDRTWVSGTGDDANAAQDCPRSNPCKTFAVALAQTNIAGEINVASPGSFGPMVIDKAVTVDAGGMFAGIQVTNGGTGVTINAPSNAQVALRGLTINGLFTFSVPTSNGATGIKFNTGNALYVENCVVENLSNIGIDFTPPGVSFLFVKDTIVRNCINAGIQVLGGGSSLTTAKASIDKARLEGNAYGVRAANHSDVTVRDSVATGSGKVGFYAESTAASAAILRLESCVATNNVVGVALFFDNGVLGRIFLSNVTIYGNFTAGIQRSSNAPESFASIVSFGNNHNTDVGAPTTTLPPQ